MNVDKILEGLKKKYANEKVTDIDGVKIDFAHGWVHLRKSNTEPIIRIYSEAKDEAAANQLAEEVIATAKTLFWDWVGFMLHGTWCDGAERIFAGQNSLCPAGFYMVLFNIQD